MRILKKAGIALLVFIFVLMIATTATLWYVFTPEKLTPLINEQAEKYLSCNTEIEKVEPTFFGSYPFFGVEITNLCLTENTSKEDTLLYTPKCFGSVDIMSYLSDDNISFNSFLVDGGYLNFMIDSFGQSNFDILKDTSSSDADTTALSLGDIDISNVEFKNFNAKYSDATTFSKTEIKNINAKLRLKYNKANQLIDFDMQLDQLQYLTSDSLALFIDAKKCVVEIESKASDINLFGSDLMFACKSMSVSIAGDTILSRMKINTHLPFSYNLEKNSCDLDKSTLLINQEQEISLSGNVTLQDDNSISTNIEYTTNTMDVEKIIALVPEAYSEYLEGLSAKGLAQLSGSVEGLVTDILLPLVKTNIEYKEGEIKYAEYPTVKDIKLSISSLIDMNETQSSDITINSSYARIMRSNISAKGLITDILDSPRYDIYTDGVYNLDDFKSYIPEDQNVNVRGLLKGSLHTRFSQSDIDKEAYHRIYLTSNLKAKDFYAVYNDSMKVDLPSAKVKIHLPSQKRTDKNLKLATVKIDAPNLDIVISPEMQAVTEDLELTVDINNMSKNLSSPITSCTYKMGHLYTKADTITVKANNVNGEFEYTPTLKEDKEVAIINSIINSKEIVLANNDAIMFDAKNIYAKTDLEYDETQTDAMMQWQPDVAIRFYDAVYKVNKQLQGEVSIMDCTLDPETMDVKEVDFTIGDSDYNLKGELSNITKYINNEGLLIGDFDLVSDYTDAFALMDIFNGMGGDEAVLADEERANTEDDPFMVPKGIEIRLNTKIKKSLVNDNIIKNIGGGLTVKDGILILDQMGFTNKAAHMQLTAMYRSDRKNHLFTGIDFHLLNIDIKELIELIPSVDEMVPMLKSFDGRGEFHLAGETYLKSDYSLKQSTVRYAAAFEGQELTIMDSETFDMIASKLQFKKKTKNVIDSLSVEMTVFKDEIDLYPFLVVMDKYKAVISGHHTMDNRFKYHISVTDTPLPVRLGLDVGGTLDALDYKLVPCQYKHLYNPKKQGAIEKRTLRLKKLISDSLKKNVKPIE